MICFRNPVVCVVLLLLTACGKDKEEFTVVQGRVTDKYTGRGLGRVRVEVEQHTPNFTFIRRESVATTTTDPNGEYELAFNATSKPRQKYRISLSPTDSVYDLTTYQDFDDATHGVLLKKGSRNQVDFTATPYKTVMVQVEASKGGKNYLSIGCSTIDRGDVFGVSILDDTARANQHFSLVIPVRLLPMRTYRFQVTTCNRVKTSTSNYNFVDYSTIRYRERQVLYNDTTTVVLR